jgi:hypothetical protein
MSKAFAIGLFLALLAVGVMFGVARDVYSRERAVVKGVITETNPGGAASKAQPLRGPGMKVRLESGTVVDVAVTSTSGFTGGQTVSVSEMVMPWGQVWYKLKGE